MSQPRYAPAGSSFSLHGALFSVIVLGLAALLCLPAVARTSGPAAAVVPGGAVDRSVTMPGAAPQGQPSRAAAGMPVWVGAIPIHPSQFRAAPNAAPVVQDGVVGPAADGGQLGIPAMVLHAYRLAAAELAAEQPACHLPWWLLAGIGHTESGHAESGRLYADGTTRGRILGPRLNGGIAGDAIISDTDHGAYDGDTVYDRAVGPMQFIPSTWRHWGADGNHDGKRDPNNIFDATLAAGRYLCADGRNLATTAGLDAAVLSYNHSQAYLATVLAWGYAYRSGAAAVADSPAPVVGDVTKVRPPITARPPKKPVRLPAPGHSAAAPDAAAGPGATHPATPSKSAAAPTSSASSPVASSSGSASGSPSASCTTPAVSDSSTSSGAAPSGGSSASAASARAAASAASASAASADPAQSADGGSATEPSGQPTAHGTSSNSAATASSASSSAAATTTPASPSCGR